MGDAWRLQEHTMETHHKGAVLGSARDGQTVDLNQRSCIAEWREQTASKLSPAGVNLGGEQADPAGHRPVGLESIGRRFMPRTALKWLCLTWIKGTKHSEMPAERQNDCMERDYCS